MITFQRIYNQKNIKFVELDISQNNIDQIFENNDVKVIYHLAQQASAPYSMKNIENTIFTARNNEIGNLQILYAIKNFCPEAHLIKLGSFGEYCTTEIDVAEEFSSNLHLMVKLQ